LEAENKKKSGYKHAEHSWFLDGVATGNFGAPTTVTNIDLTKTTEDTPIPSNDTSPIGSEHGDQEGNNDDDVLQMAATSLNNSINEDELKIIQQLKSETRDKFPEGKTPTNP
jgi:hypothetical protein